MRLLTLNSVLVATDLGEASGSAIRAGARLAPLAGASLHLLHVTGDHTGADERRLHEHFRAVAPDAADPDSIRVMYGTPAAVILHHAVHLRADVVILGPHRGLPSTGPLGSTAASVVQDAPCPCLVVASELALPLQRVLAPVDDSPASSGALLLALSWASALRSPGETAELVALHVTQSPESEREHALVRDAVERVRDRARGAAPVDIRERVVSGSEPADGILREAATWSADLLVMGTSAAYRKAPTLGSVSAAVARNTPCPLLLVPPAVWQQRSGIG